MARAAKVDLPLSGISYSLGNNIVNGNLLVKATDVGIGGTYIYLMPAELADASFDHGYPLKVNESIVLEHVGNTNEWKVMSEDINNCIVNWVIL